jgi:hypothetical protein
MSAPTICRGNATIGAGYDRKVTNLFEPPGAY